VKKRSHGPPSGWKLIYAAKGGEIRLNLAEKEASHSLHRTGRDRWKKKTESRGGGRKSASLLISQEGWKGELRKKWGGHSSERKF